MKKLIYTFVALALATTSASAQFDKSWTFESLTPSATNITTNLEVGDLKIHASTASGSEIGVSSVKKSVEIGGEKVDYTTAVVLRGVPSATGRIISFPVTGACEITVACYHGTTSSAGSDRKRIINVGYGENYGSANLQSVVVPTGGAGFAGTTRYEINEPTTIYLTSGGSSVGVLGVYIKYLTPLISAASTAPMTWDFTKVLSETDLANLTADTENWTPSASGSNTRYGYPTKTVDADGKISFEGYDVIDNFFGYPLIANGVELEATKGLRFGRLNGSIAPDRFRVGDKRLTVQGTDIGFIIPNLKRNDVVEVVFASGTTTGNRSLVLMNATTTDALTSSGSSDRKTVRCTVLSDGCVGFRGTNSLYYYSVKVNPDNATPTAISLDAADTDFYSVYTNYDAEIPDGVTAYTAALSADESAVELTQVTGTVLERNKGYIVKATSVGTYDFNVSATMCDKIDGNELKGVTVDTQASDIEAANPGKTVIMLGLKNGVPGFRKPAGGMIEANKAYMLVDTPVSSSPSYSIKVDGGTTGIGFVTVDGRDDNAPAFNLSGQRVGRGFKGIVLVGGRKVIRK